MKQIELVVPGLREMENRARWLSDPETMAYNRANGIDAEGYDVATGCIEFPKSDWGYWRGAWLWQEPSRYAGFIKDKETGECVGEVCYYFDMEEDAHGTGVLVEAKYRGQGYGTAALRALCERAFSREEVEKLCVDLPMDRDTAIRMYLSAGFTEVHSGQGIVRLERTRTAEDK